MILIAHRGNLNGKIPDKENHPDYIDRALSQGYEVEVDIWYVDGKWVLGHDDPQYLVGENYLDCRRNNLWIHIKDLNALEFLTTREHNSITRQWNYFWHQKDDYTVTNRGRIWALPGSELTTSSICVMPEYASYTDEQILNSAGVCSDYVSKWRFDG